MRRARKFLVNLHGISARRVNCFHETDRPSACLCSRDFQLGGVGSAQETREPGGPRAPTVERKPPAELRSDMLDSLFARLRKVDTPAEAQIVETAIWELWMRSDSPTAEVLLGQAVKALGAGEEQASLSILNAWSKSIRNSPKPGTSAPPSIS